MRHQLLEARECEVRVHDVQGYRGTLAGIAQQREAQRPSYGWIEEYIERAAGEPPLSSAAIVAWRTELLDQALIADEPNAAMRLVELADIVDPHRLADLGASERRAADGAARYDSLRAHLAYPGVRRLSPEGRQALGARMSTLAREISALACRRETWMRDALDDVLHGRPHPWIARRAEIAHLIEQAEPVLTALGPVTDVHVQGDAAGIDSLAAALLDHLQAGGRLKLSADGRPKIGPLSPRAIKQASPLFEQVRVDGCPPNSPERIRAFLTWVNGARLLAALDRAWPVGVVIPPEDTLRERLQWHRTELWLLQRVLEVGAELQREEQHLEAAGLPRPNWSDDRELQAYAALPEAADTADTAAEAARPLDELAEDLAGVTRWPDAEPVVARLLDAVRRRDHAAYLDGHHRLARLHDVRARVAQREQTGRRLSATAPALAAALATGPGGDQWDVLLPTFAESWNWAAAGTWIADRTHLDVNGLQRQINDIEDRIREHVQQLAAIRAWSHAVAPTRLSPRSRASLEQYAALVRRLGKGTGKYARAAPGRDPRGHGPLPTGRPGVDHADLPDRRTVARSSRTCSTSSSSTRRRRPASRPRSCSTSRRKIVVIGDDKQVSPSAVGVDQQQLRDLANQYLYDDPLPGLVAGPASAASSTRRRCASAACSRSSSTAAACPRSSASRTGSPTSPTACASSRYASTARTGSSRSRPSSSTDGYERGADQPRSTRPRSTPSSTRSRSASPTRGTTG